MSTRKENDERYAKLATMTMETVERAKAHARNATPRPITRADMDKIQEQIRKGPSPSPAIRSARQLGEWDSMIQDRPKLFGTELDPAVAEMIKTAEHASGGRVSHVAVPRVPQTLQEEIENYQTMGDIPEPLTDPQRAFLKNQELNRRMRSIGEQEPSTRPSQATSRPEVDEAPMQRIHRIKSSPSQFDQLEIGKQHEVRKADRDYREGDYLLLNEYNEETMTYTGFWKARRITHVTPPGLWGLPTDVCVLSIAPLDPALDGIMVDYFLNSHEPEETYNANQKAQDAARTYGTLPQREWKPEGFALPPLAGQFESRGFTQHQLDLIDHLIQEAGEVVKAATKLRLFGRTATDPHTGANWDNVQKLGLECGNLQHMISVCFAADLIVDRDLQQGACEKQIGLERYLRP